MKPRKKLQSKKRRMWNAADKKPVRRDVPRWWDLVAAI